MVHAAPDCQRRDSVAAFVKCPKFIGHPQPPPSRLATLKRTPLGCLPRQGDQRLYLKVGPSSSGAFIQFAASLLLLLPLAWRVEGFVVHWHWPLLGAMAYLVILASILAVNALHALMRRGHATKVTSLFFLTPIVAVLLEWVMFAIVPTPLSILGIALTCAGVALVAAGRR